MVDGANPGAKREESSESESGSLSLSTSIGSPLERAVRRRSRVRIPLEQIFCTDTTDECELALTSNPGAADFELQKLADERLFEKVIRLNVGFMGLVS